MHKIKKKKKKKKKKKDTDAHYYARMHPLENLEKKSNLVCFGVYCILIRFQ